MIGAFDNNRGYLMRWRSRLRYSILANWRLWLALAALVGVDFVLTRALGGKP